MQVSYYRLRESGDGYMFGKFPNEAFSIYVEYSAYFQAFLILF